MIIRTDCMQNARVRNVYSPTLLRLLHQPEGAPRSDEALQAEAKFLNELPRPYNCGVPVNETAPRAPETLVSRAIEAIAERLSGF